MFKRLFQHSLVKWLNILLYWILSIKIKQIKDDKGLTSAWSVGRASGPGTWQIVAGAEREAQTLDTWNHPDPPSPLDPSDTPGVLVMLCDVMWCLICLMATNFWYYSLGEVEGAGYFFILFLLKDIERYWKILKVLGGAIVNQIWTIVQDGLFIAGSCFGFGCTAWMSKGWCLACVGVLHQTRDLNVHSICPSTVNVLLFSSWPSPFMISFLVRLQCLFCLGHHRSLLLLLHCPSQLF